MGKYVFKHVAQESIQANAYKKARNLNIFIASDFATDLYLVRLARQAYSHVNNA